MILGIDEVGRGPWAGPLVIGAVVLEDPEDQKWQHLKDSKKLSASARKRLSPLILEEAVATGLGWVTAQEIDELNLSKSLRLATYRAICDLLGVKFKINNASDFDREVGKIMKKNPENGLPFSRIVIDGKMDFLVGTKLSEMVTLLPKADSKVKEVSAASIIAKVARDNYMHELAKEYPEYGFERHVGYGTQLHKKMLNKYGPCPEHRKSVKPVAAMVVSPVAKPAVSPVANTTQIGRRAEQVVADYLKSKGQKIIARNYKTKYYEIDIISATKNRIYFTEVKYRKGTNYGTPLEQIDAKKYQQMYFAAEAFMQFLCKKLNRKLRTMPAPTLAAASVLGEDFTLEKWVEL